MRRPRPAREEDAERQGGEDAGRPGSCLGMLGRKEGSGGWAPVPWFSSETCASGEECLLETWRQALDSAPRRPWQREWKRQPSFSSHATYLGDRKSERCNAVRPGRDYRTWVQSRLLVLKLDLPGRLDYRAGSRRVFALAPTAFPSWTTFGRAGLDPNDPATFRRAGLDPYSYLRAQGSTPRFLWRRNSGKA